MPIELRRNAAACTSMEHCGVAGTDVPSTEVLDALSVMPSAIRRVGRTNVWLAMGEDKFVLRAHPTAGVGESGDATRYGTSGLAALAIAGLPRSSGDAMTQVEEAVAWVHDLLILLGTNTVPSPMPLLNGDTFRRIGDVVWETVSFMPGEVVGDRPTPDLREMGAFLARYHVASAAVSIRERPSRTPIGQLGSVVDWSYAAATMHTDGAELRTLIDELDDDLRALGHADLSRCVLHGDPTAHNMLTEADPCRPCGLIDFDLAYHDPPSADIAFAMWRSGRPASNAPRIDLDRLRVFVAGYQTVRPLDDVERAAIPVYLRARGLQMLAKRTRLRIADQGPLEQVRWIRAHHDQLVRIVSR